MGPEGAGEGHFLCDRYKWVMQKNLSPLQLLSSLLGGKNILVFTSKSALLAECIQREVFRL